VQTTSLSTNQINQSPIARTVRRHFTPEERQAVLERYRRSGLKQGPFSAGEGISKASLGKWLQEEKRKARTKLQKPRFQEVLLKQARGDWQIEIVSPQNWTVRFATAPGAEAMERLLRLLPC
jgi:hypothetical protein